VAAGTAPGGSGTDTCFGGPYAATVMSNYGQWPTTEAGMLKPTVAWPGNIVSNARVSKAKIGQ